MRGKNCGDFVKAIGAAAPWSVCSTLDRVVRVRVLAGDIDPMQKWLPLNYSFVHIQNSPTNLVRNKKFFRIFVSKTRLVGLF